jgi:hypothetical protein
MSADAYMWVVFLSGVICQLGATGCLIAAMHHYRKAARHWQNAATTWATTAELMKEERAVLAEKWQLMMGGTIPTDDELKQK